ncbi:MAG: glycosyltransferase family 2 protein, partial [Burkholderiales bacterium]
VCHHPNLVALRQQVDTLLALPQGEAATLSLLLVDNGSEEDQCAVMRQWSTLDARIRLSELGENRGIAVAHNHGISHAKAHGFTHVLLMDQDSLPAADMVAQLAQAMHRLTLLDPHVAAVGPHYEDPVLGNPPDFVRIHALGIRRHDAHPARPIVGVDYLISSGCLISLPALEAIGGMQEALFIDYVDIEWGLRARRLGWNLYGIFAAHMTHSLGPQVVRFFWRRFPLHSPQRHYFVVRNALWLYRDGGLPFSWRIPHGIRLVLRFTVYLLMGGSRRERLKYIGRGIRDGLAGRMGKPAWLR